MPSIKRPKRIENKQHDPFYDSAHWRSLSKYHKATNPFCSQCGNIGHVCDHILPRRLFPELELIKDNLQTLCIKCDQTKRQEERWITTRQEALEKLKKYLNTELLRLVVII